MAKKTTQTVDTQITDNNAVNAGTLPICRKCGVTVTETNTGSVSREGKATCANCLGAPATAISTGDMRTAFVTDDTGHVTVIPPPANAPVKVDAKNTTAKADPAKAPKATLPALPETPAAGPAPTDAPTKRAKANAAAVKAEDVEKATTEWTTVTTLFKDGVKRPDIAKQTGLGYSRVTFILWHLQYGVPGIPGMPSYTKEAKDAAQTRYEADVAAKKASKSA